MSTANTNPPVNVMLDLETLGVSPGCKILSIGACAFALGLDNDSDNDSDNDARIYTGSKYFSINASTISQDAYGLKENQGTLDWWHTQPQSALDATTAGAVSVEEALERFTDWITSLNAPIIIWGNGASFDAPVLSAVYDAVGMKQPWSFRNERCYRTLAALGRQLGVLYTGPSAPAHIALSDAKAQAAYAERVLRQIGVY
jgi:hypothetical protein